VDSRKNKLLLGCSTVVYPSMGVNSGYFVILETVERKKYTRNQYLNNPVLVILGI